MKQVPGTLGNSKFLRRLVLMLFFLNFLKVICNSPKEKSHCLSLENKWEMLQTISSSSESVWAVLPFRMCSLRDEA